LFQPISLKEKWEKNCFGFAWPKYQRKNKRGGALCLPSNRDSEMFVVRI
jgi:hypothetical protein